MRDKARPVSFQDGTTSPSTTGQLVTLEKPLWPHQAKQLQLITTQQNTTQLNTRHSRDFKVHCNVFVTCPPLQVLSWKRGSGSNSKHINRFIKLLKGFYVHNSDVISRFTVI